MLIDSHCHLDGYEDIPAILAHAREAGVTKLLAIGIGNGPADMHRALELSHRHPEVFASAGIHPQEAHQVTPGALGKLSELARDPRCLAIGEIGLDYYHADNPEAEAQAEAFVVQVKIAAEVRKPILIHCRTSELAAPAAKARFGSADAWDDLLGLIAAHWTPTGLPGVMHCFSGDEEQARRSLAAGFTLSFAGNVTYPKSTAIQAIAQWAPEDRILVETDAPFLAPAPLRGQRNEPANVALTARFVAGLRGVPFEVLSQQTTRNFSALFPESLAAAESM